MTKIAKIVVRVEQLGTFGKKDWRAIEASLDAVGISLDAQMIGDSPQRPLRKALQDTAYFYTLPKPPTANQRAIEVENAQSATENALRALRFVGAGLYNYPDRNMRSDAAVDRALYDLMTWKIAELQKRVAKLKAMSGSSELNRRTAERDYWRELTRLWLGITNVSRDRRKHLSRFLFACSQPRPFNTPGLEQRIKDFVHDFFAKRAGGNEI